MDSAIKKLFGLLRADAKKNYGADYTATVTRVEGNTAYVQMDGAEINDTPVAMTINAGIGNRVRVRVSNGRAWITGNDDSPPTDNSYARKVNEVLTGNITQTNEKLGIVGKALEAVRKIAGNTDQYFWHVETGTDTGAHITEKPKDEFLADPENAGGNLLARSNGIAMRNGLTELAAFSAEGMTVYSPDGYGDEIAHLGYGTVSGEDQSEISGTYFTFGFRNPEYDIGGYSIGAGLGVAASGYAAFSEGRNSLAAGTACHAEGVGSIARGIAAHAEGGSSQAKREYAHAQNLGTIASSPSQTAMGKYNVEDANQANALIVGNGTSAGNRSNALELSWRGSMKIAGALTQSSDRRLKEHLSFIDGGEAAEFVRSLKPACFRREGEKRLGFYAQDVQAVDKWDCLIDEMNGYLALNYVDIIAPLVRYCQELEKRIDKLEDK